MALDAGLGGGISYSPQRVTLDWWDEEERKRKESLGIAGAPKPAQADVPKPTRWDSVAEKPRDYFLQRAEQVRQQNAERFTASNGEPMDDLVAYQKLKQAMGDDKLKKRISDVGNIWSAYLPGVPGAEGVWQLVKSGYTLEEIDEMCRQAGNVVFGIGGSLDVGEVRKNATEQYMRQNKLNPEDPYSRLSATMKMRGYQKPGESVIEKVGSKLADFFGLARNEDGTINWGWTGVSGEVVRFWEHPNEVAGAAALVLSFGNPAALAPVALEGGVATGATLAAAQTETAAATMLTKLTSSTAGALLKTGAVIKGSSDAIGAADAQWGADAAAFRAAEEAYRRSQAGANVYLVRITDEITGRMWKADSNTALSVQTALQEGSKDEYGNVMDPGYGHDLKADGAWTNEWDEVLRQAVSDEVSANIQIQREWMEQGYAESYYTIDGDMDTDQWRKARQLAYTDLIKKAELFEKDPVYMSQLDMASIPVTSAGWQALVNRLKSEGIAQAPLKAMISIIGTFGGGYNAVWAGVEHTMKRENDPIYQSLRQQLSEYAKSSGLYKEGELALLTTRYAFMDDELANGKLKDDPKAQEIAAKMKQRTMQLVSAGFSPSTIGIIGHALNLPYEEVEHFRENNEDLDLGLNLLRDVLFAKYAAKPLRNAKKGAPIDATEAGFKGSNLAGLRVKEFSKFIREQQPGLASDVLRGSDAPAIARLFTEAFEGKNTSGGFWRNLAHDIRLDIENGDLQSAAAKLERGGIDATQAQAAAGKAQAKYNPTKTPADNIKAMAGELAKEQRATKTLLDLDRAAMDHLAAGYASGMSIFPYFRATQFAGGGLAAEAHRSWLNMVGGIESPMLKKFFSKITLRFFERSPVEAQEFLSQDGPARVFEAAYAASAGDIGFAIKMRNKWVMSRSKYQFDAVAEQIKLQANKNFKLKEGTESRKTALGVDPKTGETAKALADTGQEAYKAMFRDARQTLWAPRNLDLLTGSEKAWWQVVGNPWRKLGRGLKKANDPLRRWTVGFPLLFTKHAFTDSSRTFIEAGATAFFDAFRKGKAFEEALAELSPDVANSIRANLHKAKMSEQHYNIGSEGIPFHFVAKKMYELDENMNFKETNMAEGVEALRRIAIGRAFQEYAKGGMQAVADWLINTKEGKQFLYRSGNVTVTKEFLKEMGVEVKGAEMYEAAVADYVQRMGDGYFEALDLTAPQIAAGLKEMSLNKVPLTQKNIEALVRRVNANGVVENPFLSMPPESVPGNLQKYFGKGGAANRTALFMTPNKWNRQVLYKASFKRFYDEMKKQGMVPDTAAKVAMDLAELEVTRVHFDLANALYFEAQNRWFAWFGTKHRLYNTYLLKMATERPAIAGAAMTLLEYLEDKNNENPSASEWDKFNIRIPIDWMPGRKPGDEWVMNPATIVWLVEYPLESSTAQVMKIGGASLVNTITGETTIHQDTGDFGLSTGRWDGIALTTSVAVAALANSRVAEDDSWLAPFLDQKWIPERVKKRIAKGMSLVQFDAVANGQTVTPNEAFTKSMMSAMIYEYIQLAKPLSGRISTGTEGKLNALMKQYDATSPENRPEFVRDHPEVAAAFGMYTMNPATKMIIDEGWRAVQKATEEKAKAYEQALDDGTVFDSAVMKAIQNKWDTQVERLTNPEWRDPQTGEPALEYNEEFAKVWKQSGYETFTREEGINLLFPWSDAKEISMSGYVPTQAQQEKEAATLNEGYKQRIDELGWSGLATDSPALFWLKNDMVVEPMRKFTKNAAQGDVAWASRKEETIARSLARGEAGPGKSTAYMNEVHLRYMMEAYGKGTDSRATKGVDNSAPLFSKMTTEGKAEIDWTSDKSAEYIWRRWAMQKAIQQVWMRQHGISSSSTQGKQITAALTEWAEGQAQGNKYFGREWEFANKPLHERLKEIGVGTTGKESDQGWQEFLALVTSYHADLANTPNVSTRKNGVSPGAQAAAPVTRAYLEELLELKRRHSKWWQEFSQMYTPSKFGFYWRLEDNRDRELFGSEEQLPYDEGFEVM